MSKRQAKQDETGKKPRGKAPTAPQPGVRDNDQINLTDEESRIMPVSGGGFEQCYNAQAGVDADTMLVVATTLTQAPNDKSQVQPILQVLQEQAPTLGTVTTLIADTGYCSENNVNFCEEAKVVPLIAVACQDHLPHWSERFTEPPAPQADARPMPGRCHANAGDEAPLGNVGRQGRLRHSQTNGGAGVWDHQIGDGFQAVLFARFAQSHG